jgi:hypothetical protein
MVDTGRSYKCDETREEYSVLGQQENIIVFCIFSRFPFENVSTNIFKRKTGEDERKNRFYTREFALVATVSENLRRYTTREMKQMDSLLSASDT